MKNNPKITQIISMIAFFGMMLAQEVTSAIVIRKSSSAISEFLSKADGKIEAIDDKTAVWHSELSPVDSMIIMLDSNGKPIPEELEAQASWLLGSLNTFNRQKVEIIMGMIVDIIPPLQDIQDVGRKRNQINGKTKKELGQFRDSVLVDMGVILNKVQDIRFLNRDVDEIKLQGIEDEILSYIGSLDFNISPGRGNVSILGRLLEKLDSIYSGLETVHSSLMNENAALIDVSLSQMVNSVDSHLSNGAVADYESTVAEMSSDINSRQNLIRALQRNQLAKVNPEVAQNSYTRQGVIDAIIHGNYNWKNTPTNK